jgi:hypothetical protein
VVFLGSFSTNTSITVTKKQNSAYADLTASFASFKQLNTQYDGYYLGDIYVFDYQNYTAASNGTKTTIKLYMPELFADNSASAASKLGIKLAADGGYYVATLTTDGVMTAREAYRDGDYLCIETTDEQIKAVSVLATEQTEISAKYDWILYVGIAIAAILVAAAVIIVIKRE